MTRRRSPSEGEVLHRRLRRNLPWVSAVARRLLSGGRSLSEGEASRLRTHENLPWVSAVARRLLTGGRSLRGGRRSATKVDFPHSVQERG